MKNLVLFFSFFITSISLFSQSDTLIKIPKKTAESVQLLTAYLVDGLSTEEEKVTAIYEWVTSNIDYNYNRIDSDKPFNTKTVDKTLKSKKAICNEYCSLIKSMLNEVNIKSEIVNGYVQTALIDSMVPPKGDTHAWLAIKIDNIWKLTDPTWDSGYIGNVRTNKNEKFDKKFDKLDEKYTKIFAKLNTNLAEGGSESEKSKIQKKIKQTETKKIKSEERLNKQKDKKPDFTGKVGFVKNPAKDWFLIPADSFLLGHLPNLPQWQLKQDTISVSDFAKGEDSLNYRLAQTKSSNFDYETKIVNFQSKDFLEQLLVEAETAILYNPKNYQVKALNYHNYVSYISDKKIQKTIPNKYKLYNYNVLLPMVDSAKVYAKLASKESKNTFSYYKKCYKTLYKQDQAKFKVYTKLTDKSIKLNQKTIENIKKRNEKLEKELESIAKAILKLENISSETKIVQKNDSILVLIDSINALAQSFDDEKKKWKKATKADYLQNILDRIIYNENLHSAKNYYIEYQDYELNDYLMKIDSFIDSNNRYLKVLYTQKLPIEMLSFEPKNIIKKMEMLRAKIQKYSKTQNLPHVEATLQNINYIILNAYKQLESMNKYAVKHNDWMIDNLKSFKSQWGYVKSRVKKREKFIEDRFSYNFERIGHNYNRDTNLFDDVLKHCDKWKSEFKKKSDEK